MSTQEEKRKFSLVSEATLLALLSSSVYLLVFFYEWGFTSYFYIPPQLIKVDLDRILIFLGISFLLLPSLYYVLHAMFFEKMELYVPSESRLDLILRLIAWLFPVFIIGIIVIITSRSSYYFYWLLTVLISLLILQSILLYQGHEKLIQFLGMQTVTVLAGRFGSGPTFMLLLLPAGLWLAVTVGLVEASFQYTFLVTNTTPEMVVLRIYGDNLICAPFDRSTKEVQSNFRVLKIADDPNLSMNLEEVGPLTLPKPPMPTPTVTPIRFVTVTPMMTPAVISPTFVSPKP